MAETASGPVWIALLRGINVGGAGRLPMADLKAALSDLGCADVQTYIQTGNAVFRCAAKAGEALAADVADAIASRHGFRPHVMVLDQHRFNRIIGGNPFPEAAANGKVVHAFVLAHPAKNADHARLDALAASTERWQLTTDAFYLHAPDGIGRSKLAARAESILGVPATARNWRTMVEIERLAREVS